MQAEKTLNVPPLQLPGEDAGTVGIDQVASWISIYGELAKVVRSILSNADGRPESAELAQDLIWIESRLEMWRKRHAELAGLGLDRETHQLTYAGRSVRLTRRETELLDYLLQHPQRLFTTRQLASVAWQNGRLSDAQVRTYVKRLRGRLLEIGLGRVIEAVKNRGYRVAVHPGPEIDVG